MFEPPKTSVRARRVSALILVLSLISSAGLVAIRPAAAAEWDASPLDFSADALMAGSAIGIVLREGVLTLSNDAPQSDVYAPYRRFGIAESVPSILETPATIRSLRTDGEVGSDSAVVAEMRGRVGGRWTEWREPSALSELQGADAVQTRVTLLAMSPPTPPEIPSASRPPEVRGLQMLASPVRLLRAAQATTPASPTVRVWATRIGLVGALTANGHVVEDRDRFVALPSKRVLNRIGGQDYRVLVSYRGRQAVAPVWDIGPWNMRDDYWNENREAFTDLPRWTSQAEAAYFRGHNSGQDGFGRFISVPTSIDLADGTFWDDLGMTENDWVDVTFLWLDGSSPAPRLTPSIEPKVPVVTAGPSAPIDNRRAASYNVPIPASRVYAPLLTRDAAGWTSSLTVQNASTNPVEATIELIGEQSGRVAALDFGLPAAGSRTLSLAEVDSVPHGFSGAGVVTAGGPVALVVSADRPGSDRSAYEGVGAGSPTVAAPLVFKDYSGWSTSVHVQNLGATGATVRIAYQGPAGPVGVESATIAPSGSRAFLVPVVAAQGHGFVGSALIQSTNGQPLAAVMSSTRTDGSTTANSGLAAGAQKLYAPLLFKGYNGWDTGLQILNLGSVSTLAGVTYRAGGASFTDATTLPGGGSLTIYQPAQSQLPNGYAGTATVAASGGSRLAGLVSGIKGGSVAAMSYVLGQPPSTSLAAPLVSRDDDGWDSGLQVLNPGGTAASFVATFFDQSGALVHRQEESLEAGSTRTFYSPAMPELPLRFRGSVILQSTGAGLTAIVNAATR